MPVISVRVEEDVKRQMEKLKHINWSEVIRSAVLRVIEEEKGRNLAKAVLLNEKIRKTAPKGWNSTDLIRHWRESRYGERGQ